MAGLGPRQVIIKLGEAGAVALIDGNDYQRMPSKCPLLTRSVPGTHSSPATSPVLNEDFDSHQRMGKAVRTGAFACIVPGDWEGMPRRGELGMLEQSEPVAR